MARHEAASSKPDPTTVASVENPTQAEDQDETGGGWAGGGSTHVFEVANLLIPAGTDWTAGHEIGRAQVSAYAGIDFCYVIELADALPSGHVVQFAAVTGPNAFLHTQPVVIGRRWVVGNGWSPGNAGMTVLALLAAQDDSLPIDDPQTVSAVIRASADPLGSGPTTADITVVRARAAFLVI